MNLKKIEEVAQRARRAFLAFDGVLGVGYGPKRVRKKETDATAIIVFVEKKLSPDKVKEGQLIPKSFDEYMTDVEEVRFSTEEFEADKSGHYEGRPMAEFLDWGKIHQLNIRQKKQTRGGPDAKKKKKPAKKGNPPADLNTPVTEIRGNLYVIDDDGTLVYTTSGGQKLVDLVGAWNLFRADLGDDYDFVVFYLDDTDPNIPNMGNFSSDIFRSSSDGGIGRGAVNNRSTWGNSTRLLRYVCHSWYSLRTMLHEIGHQWLFYVNYRNTQTGSEQGLLHESWDGTWSAGQKPFHPGRWPDNDRSCMDYDHDDWTEVASGIYRINNPADAEFNFCPLDQYLMGLLNPEAVSSSRVIPTTYPVSGSDFQIINNPTLRPDGDYNSTPVAITAQNIIWNEGARVPNHLNSQRVFHQATIAITSDRATHAAFLTDSETRRADHTKNWRRATSGRSIMDTSLLRANFDDIYIRDNMSDTGEASSIGVFCNSPDLFIRRQPDDPNLYSNPATPNNTIHERPRSNQDNWVYARIHNKSAIAYDNVTVNFYIANYHGFSGRDTVAAAVPRTQVIFPIDWHPDSLIGSATLTTVPANGTAVARVQWNQADIPDASWHPCLVAEVIPLGTSPMALHHPRESKKLAQKNLHIEYITADEHESDFPFVIGHAISPAKFSVLQLHVEKEIPGLELLIDPTTALGETLTIGGTVFHRIPGLESVSPDEWTRITSELPGGPAPCHLVLDIPRQTLFGVGCGASESTTESMISVTFCDDTRLLLRGQRLDAKNRGFLPLKGFTLVEHAGRRLLKMTASTEATFPVPLAAIKEHEMKMTIRLVGGLNGPTAPIHIGELDESGKMIGGILIDFRRGKE
jgi:hypothetical protein